MVCSHGIAQTYACLLWSSSRWGGPFLPLLLLLPATMRALGLLCSHAPTERVPGLNACPCAWRRRGRRGEENSRRGGSHNVAHSQAFITTEGSTGVQGDQLVFLDVVARHGVSVNVQFFSHHVSLRRSPRLSVVHECIHQMGLRTDNRLNLGCHQRRGGVWWRWRGRG